MPDTIPLRPDETLEDLQLGGLRILQKKQGFRYGMDSVLLADFVRMDAEDTFADFGTGTGILPLLIMGRGKGKICEAIECQSEFAEMAGRSMELNGLTERVRIHRADIRDSETILGRCSVDHVICNPPYGLPGRVLHSPSEASDIARNLDEEGLLPWFRAAHRILRGKGRLSLVFPAPRMLELMDLLQEAKLTPKRFRLVYPRVDKPANLVLIEAVKDGKPMLHPEPPLIVYEADGRMTAELRRIYHMEGEPE
ncbi:MAG: methyltransferase [Clostridia bacterium]|nr:methyltransferase [Clostridia bacterium]